MKICVSPVINGHACKIETYLGQAFPSSEISFDGDERQGFDVVAHIEEPTSSTFLAAVGRNIIQAGGGHVLVTSSDPHLSWEGGRGDGW